MAALPYMPLYVADYLTDAAHLSTLEHGAYLLLIMTYWQRGEPLPADDKKLARICRVGAREWARLKPVISEFFQVDCTSWSHSRIDRELASVRDKSLKKRKAGLARAQQMHGTCSANAQLTVTDTDTDNTLPKGSDGEPSSGKAMWDSALAYYGGTKRALIAKWIKIYKAENFVDAMADCQRNDPLDRIAWTEAALKARKRGGDDEYQFNGFC